MTIKSLSSIQVGITALVSVLAVTMLAFPVSVMADGTDWNEYTPVSDTGWNEYTPYYSTDDYGWETEYQNNYDVYSTDDYGWEPEYQNNYDVYSTDNYGWEPEYQNNYDVYDYSYSQPSYNYSYTPPSYNYSSYDYSYDYTYDSYHYSCADMGKTGTYPNCHTQVIDYCSNLSGNQPSGYDCYPPQHNDTPVCDISASDSSIDDDESTTLHWTSENATSATLTSFGSVSTGGSKSVSPNDDTTYTLRVTGNGGSDTCTVTVRVQEKESESPSCDLHASDTRVSEGDRVTLTWDTDNATRATINQGVGTVDEDGGSERVTVDEDTTYKMTVRNDDGDEDTCSVTVRVDEDNNFSSVSFTGESVNNPPVVYLSDIPYTGLEDIDPILLSYWLMLIAGASAIGWTLYTKGMIPNFAFASAYAESTEDGDADDAVPAEPAAYVSSEVDSFLAALDNGDADVALDFVRDAAANGTGVEEFLASAEAATTDAELQARVSAALAASKLTGVRGVKEVLG